MAAPQLTTAAGQELVLPWGLWGDREGGRGRAATEVNAAGILLSEMAPRASLLPLAGKLLPPQVSQNSWLPLWQAPLFWGHLKGSAGAGVALFHLPSGGGCFSFLTLKAMKCQTPLQLLAERPQPPQPSWRDRRSTGNAGSYFLRIPVLWL